MGLIKWIKGAIERMFKKDAERIFGIKTIYSGKMETAINLWDKITSGEPPWVNKEDDIETINFAKFIASVTAKKICLDIDVNVTGSARADYIQDVMSALKKVIRNKVEDVCCIGGIMMKHNGALGKNCIDYVMPWDFMITDTVAGEITGAMFHEMIQKGDKYYHRMEYQHYDNNGIYVIENRAFVSNSDERLGREISLDSLQEWKGMLDVAYIENLDKPLFAYLKLPYNNTIDRTSPLGVPVFYNAIKELKDLDIAWCRKSGETDDSKHITFMTPDVIKHAGKNKIHLPRFVREADISGAASAESNIHEHTATMLTDSRIKDINSILAMISTKCGFSQGMFVLDGKTGMVTATQVEADDRETIETIKDMRDALKDTLEHLIYIVNAYADLYQITPVGVYETSYGFGDLTYNWDEDRARHWQYVQQNKYPLYKYYMEFEGMSEDEAKTVVAEAQKDVGKRQGLFEEE